MSEITVNFLELDHMRATITAYGKEHGIKLPSRKRTYWTSSGFYIGRTVIRFYFRDVGILNDDGYYDGLMMELRDRFGHDYMVGVQSGLDIIFTLRRGVNIWH